MLFKNYCRQAVFQHKQCPFCPTVFLLRCGKSKLVQCKVCVSKPTRVVFETRQPVCVGKSKYDSRVPKRLIRCTVFITFCATFSQRCFVKKRFVVFAKSSFSKITADKRFFNTNGVHFVQPFFVALCKKQICAVQGLRVKAALA